MPGHDIIVIGGSAGGLDALRGLLMELPGDLPAALFVVLHVAPDRPSLLPTLLNHTGRFLALHPADGTPIRNGCVYVAPPDHHLLLEGPLVRIVRGPRENRCRPAIDPLFRSAAACFRERVVGVVLSGNLDDGSAGLLAIRRHGGVTVVQDPQEALCRDMPSNAQKAVPVDHCLGVADIAQLLVELVRTPRPRPPASSPPVAAAAAAAVAAAVAPERELGAMAMDVRAMESDERPGSHSPYSCPDCGGVLWEIDDEGLLRFRCRVGHSYTEEGVLAGQAEGLERALWVALKTLEERASLLLRMIKRATLDQAPHLAGRFSEEFRSAEEGAATIRKALLNTRTGGAASG